MSSGMSVFGASPVAAAAKTASANLLSGPSHEPPHAAIAQWIEWTVKRAVILQRSISWVTCRAAIEMFGHSTPSPKLLTLNRPRGLSVRCGWGGRLGRSYVLRQQLPALSDRRVADVPPVPKTTTVRHRTGARSAHA